MSPASRFAVEFRLLFALLLSAAAFLTGCGGPKTVDAAAEAPPPAQVIHEGDAEILTVSDGSKFPLVTAGRADVSPTLDVNGTVAPDVSRQVPAISLASGRVAEIHARLGDYVRKGQLLMKIQSADVSSAFADYQKAIADEKLARTQLERSRDLIEKGAIARKDLEVAQDNEDDAQVILRNTAEKLRVLGANLNDPSGIVEVRAPISGYVTEQNVTVAGGVKTLDNSPNLFTISDLGQVWILCDVYENDLSSVHTGEYADVHIDAYPKVILKGRVDNIGPILDPNLRTAKVRLQVANPGMLRIGMFVRASFHSPNQKICATVPPAAILHLHDHDWVYVPQGSNKFRRVGVTSGILLAGNMQQIDSGLQPGQQVVGNALVLQNSVEQ